MRNAWQPDSWLTARRVRIHGLLLAICLWSVYCWDMSSPGLRDRNGLLKGTDFLHFYTLGLVALEHRGSELFDMHAQAVLTEARVPQAAGIYYVPLYPPQVSMFFAPLARMPYGRALVLWLVLDALTYAVCCGAVWRVCPNLRSDGMTVLILAIAFPAFFHLVAWGQTSALALACFTVAFLALRVGRQFLAGFAIGCLIFKPQLLLAAVVVFAGAAAGRLIVAAVAAATLQLASAWLYYGPGVLGRWMTAVVHVREVLPWLEPKTYQMHSLRAFWAILLPWPGVASIFYVVSSAVVLIFAVACWRSRLPLGLRYAALLVATVSVSPHLTVYDLVILAPAFLLVADWAAGERQRASNREEARSASWMRVLVYLCYALPLLGPLARWTHVQLSVVALAGLLWVVWGVAKQQPVQAAA